MTTLVIGNGFDLDLGMNTRYSDFAKSEYWPKDVSSSSHNLQQYLNERKDMDCWFDLEQCLLDYCKPQRGISFGQDPFDVKLAGDKTYFNNLREGLVAYLRSEQEKKLNKYSWASKLMIDLCKDDNFETVYSFNYTDFHHIATEIGIDLKKVSVDYVHGTLEDNTIILGVDEREVTDGYEFMQKAVEINYRSTNIISQLALSHDVIFFGHSFGTIDIEYFKPYFLHIFNQDIEEDQKHPSITIFTYNEASRLQILKHIHDMGINRQRLFNLCDFRIFRTDGSDNIRIEKFLKNRESERESSKRLRNMLPNHDHYEGG